MLTDAQKRILETEAAQDIRQQWGDVRPSALAAAVDDIRARVIEEAWFGSPQTELGRAMQDDVRFQQLYGRDLSDAERELERSADDALER